MTGARLKVLSLIFVGVLAALVLFAWSLEWFDLALPGDSNRIVVNGDVAAPALSPLALASLALVLALALAGRVFRVTLGIVETLLGIAVVTVSCIALSDPIAISAPLITERTGVTGIDSLRDLVYSYSDWFPPYLAIICGVLMAVLGLVIAITASRWPKSGRKYARSRPDVADAASPVDEWDALSEGDDPTRPESPQGGRAAPLD